MGLLTSLFQRRLVGLDIGVSGIKAVELQGGDRPRLIAYNRVPLPWQSILPDGEIQNKEAVVGGIKALFNASGFSSKKVAVGASGNAIITKKISMAKMSPDELKHQLYFEAEQYIPFDLEEVNLDFAVLGESHGTQTNATDQMMDVLIVAAKKDYINSLTGMIGEAGLSPQVIDIQAFALGNAFEFNYGHLIDSTPGRLSAIIDFGAGSTKVSVVEGDKTTFTRELRECGTSCTLMLSEQLGISLEEAESIKINDPTSPRIRDVIQDHSNQMVDEIVRTLDFCISQGSDRVLGGIYICGGGSKTYGLNETLDAKLPIPVQPLNPIQNISGSGKKMNSAAIQELSYLGAVAIGLALRTDGDSA